MSTVSNPANYPANHGAPSDPTDVVGRRVFAFLLDFLLVGVLSLVIGAAGFTNAFSAETTELDSVDEAIEFCEEANGGSPDFSGFFDGDSFCVPADVDALEISFDSSEGNIAVLPIVHGGLWLIQILLQAFTGATIGKFMTGLRVVREDGGRPGLVRSAVRTIAYFIDGFPWAPPMLLGLIASVTSKRHRRLGDRLAGTFVVNKNAAGYPVPAAHLFDVRLPPERDVGAVQRPRRDPVTGKLPPPAMPGAAPAAPGNDAVSAGAAAAARHRANQPTPPAHAPRVTDTPDWRTSSAPSAAGSTPAAPRPSVMGADASPPTPSPTGEFAGGQAVAPIASVPQASQPQVVQPATPRPAVLQSDVPQPSAAEAPTVQQPAVQQQATVQQPAVDQTVAAQQPAAQQPSAQEPAMPDGVMWDPARNTYIYSDGSRFLQWDADANTWVPM